MPAPYTGWAFSQIFVVKCFVSKDDREDVESLFKKNIIVALKFVRHFFVLGLFGGRTFHFLNEVLPGLTLTTGKYFFDRELK